MNSAGWSDFWHMGGYALYVWGSLGMCAATLLIEVLWLAHRQRKLIELIAAGADSDAGESST